MGRTFRSTISKYGLGENMKYIRTQNGNLVSIPEIKEVNSDLARLLENQKRSEQKMPKAKRKNS